MYTQRASCRVVRHGLSSSRMASCCKTTMTVLLMMGLGDMLTCMMEMPTSSCCNSFSKLSISACALSSTHNSPAAFLCNSLMSLPGRSHTGRSGPASKHGKVLTDTHTRPQAQGRCVLLCSHTALLSAPKYREAHSNQGYMQRFTGIADMKVSQFPDNLQLSVGCLR